MADWAEEKAKATVFPHRHLSDEFLNSQRKVFAKALREAYNKGFDDGRIDGYDIGYAAGHPR